MIFYIGIVLVTGGLVRIFAGDGMWKITEWLNRSKGLASDRTDEWDMSQAIGGIVAIVVGILLIVLSFMGIGP